MADRRALAVAHPDGIKEAVGLASGLHFYGHFQQATGRMSEVLASFREGRAINEIGHVLRVTGKPAEALTRERPQFQLHLPRLGPGPCGATRRGRRRPAPGHRTVAPGSRYEIRTGPGADASGRAGQGPEVWRDHCRGRVVHPTGRRRPARGRQRRLGTTRPTEGAGFRPARRPGGLPEAGGGVGSQGRAESQARKLISLTGGRFA